ncbi:MAG: UDP-3-O-(3-hydroxymyristoyl)glucosamine N-acyltransferase, partial [Planctomycetes bacterium]|nr:UDP-3-O-(3-hydroxymyristoyl)glucosamine N-acyltransferase [Planctomycetota bacterium]
AIGAGVFVGAGAGVGAGTQLHPGCYIGAHARIGRDCVVWPNVVVRERVEIGDRVIIHPNATIGSDGFGYLQQDGRHRKIPQIGTVIIEDDVEIGAGTTIDRARSGATRIGRGTKIDNLCQISHNCDIEEYCIILAHNEIAGSVTFGHHVIAAGRAGVSDHKTLGNGVQIAAAAVVMSDFPDGAIVRGSPAMDIRRYHRVQAAVHKLPKWLDRIRALTKRVEQLEAQLAQTDRDSDP